MQNLLKYFMLSSSEEWILVVNNLKQLIARQ